MKINRFFIFLLLIPIAVMIISGCSKTQSKISNKKSAILLNNNNIALAKLVSLKNYESISTGAVITTVDKIHNLNKWQEEIIVGHP